MNFNLIFRLIYNKMITILLIIICSNNIVAQISKSNTSLNLFKIQENEWFCTNLKLDTLHNHNFRPNPKFIPANPLAQEDSNYKLLVLFRSIYFSQSGNTLNLSGTIYGGDFGGWGTEVFIFVASRYDSTTLIAEAIRGNDFIKVDTINCMYLRNFDFCYTNCRFDGTRRYVEFECILNIKKDNDLLVFARNDFYTEIFDLQKIKKCVKQKIE
jgi:hypothetical protein